MRTVLDTADARARQIPSPNLYANHGMFLVDGKVDEKALQARGDAFNRYQRGHQHLFELHADAYALLFAAAVFAPIQAGYAGVLYAVGSLVYGIGYSYSNSGRYAGEAIYIPGVLWLVYIVGKGAYGLYSGSI